MKITKINIYGFGKWTNVIWDLNGEGIELIFGHNEAGKSTFMSFIFAILFGFPKRGENQYFPKGKNEYGGSITVQSSKYGEVVIERTKSRRVKGDVSVHFPDGSVKGEEALQQILHEMDEKTFQGIFYFDLDGLNISTMTPLQLNEFLYDTTMAGGKSITQLEKSLENDMEKLFKPKAKKREMNILAKQLYEKEQQIHEWEKRLNQYDKLVEKVQTLEKNIEEKKEEASLIETKSKNVTKYQWIHPLARDWHEKKLSLAERKKIEFFPENGVERLEQLNESLMEKEVRQKEEKLKYERVLEQLENVSLHEEWPILKEDVQHCIQEYELAKKWEEDINDHELELAHFSRKKEKLQKNWQEQMGDESFSFSMITNSPFIKKTYFQLKDRLYDAKQKVETIREELLRVSQQVEQKEKELKQIEEERLTDEERAYYENTVDKHRNTEDKLKYEMLTERMNERIKERKKKEKGEKQQQSFMYILIAFLFLITIASFIWSDGIVPILFVAVTFLVAIFAFWKERYGDKELREMERSIFELKKKISQLDLLFDETRRMDISKFEHLLDRDRNLMMNYETKMFEKNSLLEQDHELTVRLEKQEEILEKIKEDVHKWCNDYHLPQGLPFSLYESFLQDLEEWHKLDEQQQHLHEKYEQMKRRFNQYEEEVSRLSKKISAYVEDETLSYLVRSLKQFLQDGLNKEREKIKLEEKKKFGQEAISRLQLEIDELKLKRDELLKKGRAITEEEFRQRSNAYETEKKLIEEITQLYVQMKQIFSEDEEKLNEAIHALLYDGFDPSEEQKRLQAKKEQLEEELEQFRNELANVKNEIAHLEEDGTYDELQLQFTQLQEELQTKAKKWSTLAVAKGIIDEVKRVYEEERQPRVLKEGEAIFSQLTEGEYVHIYAPLGEERFLVERRDGMRFEPYELSRGTCELLYLALRLALSNTYMEKEEPFPLLIDEAFVNMDHTRRKNVVRMLSKMAEKRQILLFTCHEHIKNEFSAHEILL